MSNVLRNKPGNISKVKYFLPAYRNDEEPTHTIDPPRPRKQSKPTPIKKQSASKTVHRSVIEDDDISFEVVGIH